MASQFNELSALGDMQGAGKGHTTAGRVAAFGRQFAGRGGKKKGNRGDEVIRLENQAKMAAFNSQLRREELAHAHGYSLEKMREAASHTEASDVRGHGHKIAQIQTEHNAKADAEIRLHGYKMESAKEYNQDLIGQAGGIHNRGFEANPSTGAVKFSLPIKTKNESTSVSGEATSERKAARAKDALDAGASVSSTGMAVYPAPTSKDTPIDLSEYDK